MIYLLPLLTAFLFRFRGMAKPWLGQHQGELGMALYVVPMCVLIYALYPVPTPFYIPLVWVPVTLPWSKYTKNYLALTFFGFAIGLPAIIISIISPIASILFMGAACTFGVCQYVASKIPSRIPALNQGWELGEAIYGFVLGIGLILHFLWSK